MGMALPYYILMKCKKFFNLNLTTAKLNKIYLIDKIGLFNNQKLRQRLLELGLFENQEIILLRKSFLGKTLLIKIRNYVLSLRADIGENIFLKDKI